jgi:thiamine pyrophosphokinase
MQIKLPQGRFSTNVETGSTVVLVAGGRPPSSSWLTAVSRTFPVWAIDRGVDACRLASVAPEILIGDADSGSMESWRWAESFRIPVVRHPVDKDLTDLQLTLQELGTRRPGASALLTGGMGRRFDHAYSNLFSLREEASRGVQAIGLADESEALFFIEGGQFLRADFIENPIAVSLLPLSASCDNVNSQGVHWPLRAARMTMDHPCGTSNRLAIDSRSLEISLGSGLLGIYFCWNEHGL